MNIQPFQDRNKLGALLGRGLLQGLDLLAPERCLFCDQLSEQDLSICSHCEAALVQNNAGCPSCGLPGCAGQLCPGCQIDNTTMPLVIAPYEYDPMLAYLLHCWKYNGEWRLARTAAKLILKASIFAENDGIMLPTPLHWRRHIKRGFNQSEDLLLALRKLAPDRFPALRSPVRLRRTGNRQSQVQASRQERQRLAKDDFRVSGRLEGQPVTLIDDICTTGATAAAMTRALKDAGAGPVTLLCLARTPAHGPPS